MGYSLTTLLRFGPRCGGAPTLSGKDSIAHVLFWQAERPEVYRRAHAFLESKDWFNLRLTGRLAASFDSAQLFWATDTRDIDRVRWDPGLVRALGIDAAKLPPLRRSTEILGPLRPEVAEAIGLPAAVPVAVGSPDLQSACVGSGAVRDYAGHVYLGTSSWILCHVPFRRTDARHAIASLPSAIPGRWFCANEQDTAGGCLDFLIRNVLFHPGVREAAAPPPDVYERLDEAAARVPPGSGKLLFAPWLNGEKTPVDDETLRGSLHNLSLTTTIDHVVRAAYEGVAYNLRWVLGYVERFVGRRLDPLHAIGGGAQSAIWCRILADVLDRTIRQVEEPRLSNARGAAFIAAVALGRLRFDDVPDLVPIAAEFRPDPANRGVYDELFAEFVRLYGRSRDMCRRLNRR
jgi:xylulokinase